MWLAIVSAAIVVGTLQADQPSPESPRRIILDVDPGIDDAMAMLLAFRSPELSIEAVTVVAGNVVVDQGAENALMLAELAGRIDLLVAKGASRPLQKKLSTAEIIHGEHGLGEAVLPKPRMKLDRRHAVDVMLDLVNESPGEITLVPVGPLTNVALALLKDPSFAEKVPEIVLMGGSIVGGNATPAAEANIHNDPEAAKLVFQSGIPITMVGLGATGQTRITREHLPILKDGGPVGRFVAEIGDFYLRFSEKLGFDGTSLHDPLAVGVAIDKSFAKELRPMHIDVETKGELTYGETVANRNLYLEEVEDLGDRFRLTHFPRVEPNAEVPLVIDAERFLAFFLERLTQSPTMPR